MTRARTIVSSVVSAVLAGPLVLSLVSLGSALVGLVIPALSTLITVLASVYGPFILLGVAAFMIYKNWKYFKLFWQFNVIDPLTSGVGLVKAAWADIGDFFSGLWDSVVGIFTSAWAKIKPIVDAMALALPLLSPAGLGLAAGTAIGDMIVGPGPALGANQAIGRGGATSKTEAHVTVDFNGLPRGARVTQDSGSTAPLDLNYGYSMVTP